MPITHKTKKALPKGRRAKGHNPRQGKLRKDWPERWLKHYAEHRHIGEACKRIGISRDQLGRYRKENPEFNERMQAIWDSVVDTLENSMMNRAIHGYQEPVFYQGEECGTRTVHHPATGIFMLKNNRPERYGEQADKGKMTVQEKAAAALDALASMAMSIGDKVNESESED
jgi:hypothetical protein